MYNPSKDWESLRNSIIGEVHDQSHIWWLWAIRIIEMWKCQVERWNSEESSDQKYKFENCWHRDWFEYRNQHDSEGEE